MTAMIHSYVARLYYFRLKHGKVTLQLGAHQSYYVNLCEDKKSIQLIIMSTVEDTSGQEMIELISDTSDLLDNIMKVYTPAAKRPIPLCLPLYSGDVPVSTTGVSIVC